MYGIQMSIVAQSQTKIYRFKFSDNITSLIYKFSKIHQYDDRAAYKEAWNEWIDANEDEIHREINRLRLIGYIGDIESKMYKSGRYYFRTKSAQEVEPKERRHYISTSPQIIEHMDTHINMHYLTPDYSPALGFDDFCKTHKYELIQEVKFLTSKGIPFLATDIVSKIKKTYKNRYFQFTHNK
jgi:hypothetical protein